MRNIIVEQSSSDWPELFSREERLLRTALGAVAEEIHHVGSTAVPGLAAKPVVDILIIASSLKELDQCGGRMIDLDYEPKGEFGIAGRRFYSKGHDAHRTHHVHAYESTHPEVYKHLAFRDFLIAHPREAGQYAELKKRLTQLYRNDLGAYVAGKADLIAELIERALRERRHQANREKADDA